MSDEPHELVWLGRREMWAWSALIAVLGLLNLWHWITGIGGGSFGMTGAIGVATAFACLIGRMVYLVRRNRPNR